MYEQVQIKYFKVKSTWKLYVKTEKTAKEIKKSQPWHLHLNEKIKLDIYRQKNAI